MVVMATLLSAALAFALGALWYSPVLFAGPWMKAIGKQPDDLKPEPRLLVMSAVVWLVAATAFALLAYGPMAPATFGSLWMLAFVGWLAFTVPHLVMATLFQGANPALLWIDGGYHLVAMLMMAVVHALLV